MNHDPAKIAAKGFQPLGESLATMPGVGHLAKLAQRADLTRESVTAFRLLDGSWQCYARPDAVPGYVSEPMLP